jgi:hypothetical protein
MSKVDLLLNDIEINCEPAEYRSSIAVCMVNCALVIEHRLPPTARAGLLFCKGYLLNESSLQQLNGAILDCWESIRDQDCRIDIPDVSATRAILCILKHLEGAEQHDLVDQMSFFLQLVNNVEAHEDEQEALLRKHFAACLTHSEPS